MIDLPPDLEALLGELWPLLFPLLAEPVTWAVAVLLLVSSRSGRRGVRRSWRLLRRVHARRRAARLQRRRRVVLEERRERTALYRWFDGQGRLLYVGISNDVMRRTGQHEEKPWWHEVAGNTVEWFESRAAALAAEERAIKAERPMWNVVHNGGGRLVR